MANIARLGVTLGLESAEFIRGIEKAKKSVNDFAKDAMPMLKNAALAGTAAFVGMTYKALQLSDQISDLAAASELSVSSILKISDAYQQSGGKYDDAGKAVQKFTENIDSAAKGSLELQNSFKAVGVSLDDLRTMTVEELFYKSVDGLTKIEDSATKAGTKMDLFGKAMRSVDVGGFNDQLKEGTDEFDDFALGIKQAADLADKLEKTARELVLVFTRELGPTLNRIFDTINVKGGVSEKVFGGLRSIILDFWYGLEKTVITLQKLEVIINQLPGGGKQFENWREQLAALDEQEKKLRERVYGAPIVATLPPITVTGGDEGTDRPNRRNVKPGKDPASEREKKIQEMIRVAKMNADEFDRERQHASDMSSMQEHMNSLTKDQRAIQESVNEVLDATSKKIEELTNKREEAIGKEGDPRLIAAYDEQILKIQDLGSEWAALAGEQTTASLAAQKTFTYGWNQAFAQYAEDAENYATMGRDMFQAITGAMSTAIDNFVENGKFSFKDFASSIIKDLIKIELKMQAMALFRMGFKAITGAMGGSIGGSADNPLAGDITELFAGMTGAANGGVINSPTLVGERGPEIFMPGRSGTVIPNNNLSGLGGVTNITNNYIDAIDTKSFEDRIYGSSRAVWAANAYANKGLSNSRSRT